MVDKELNLKVTTNVEDGPVQDLSSNLQRLKVEADETGASLQQAFQEATAEVERLEDALSEAEINGDDIEADYLADALADARAEAEELEAALSDIDGSGFEDVAGSAEDVSASFEDASGSANDFNESIDQVNADVIRELEQEIENLKGQLDETTESSGTLVDAMASATVSAAVTAGYMNMAEAAGDYNDTMVRLGYAMTGTSMTAKQAEEQFGSTISKMASDTGRGAGAVRNHILNLANVGIRNNKILEDSFMGISQAAYQQKVPIEQLDNMFKRMVLSGRASSMMLTKFGLESKDLAKVMGVSVSDVTKKFKELDKESRASILSQAISMKYGSAVTDNYKQSFEHLLDEMDRAISYFMRTAGEALLPILIPAIQTAADVLNTLTQAFKALPEPLQNVFGGAFSVAAGFTAVSLGISGAMRFASAALSPFNSLLKLLTGKTVGDFARIMISNLIPALRGFVDVAKQAALAAVELGKQVLIAGYNALKTAAMWVFEKIQLVASTIAKGAATIASWALAVAEWAVASPIVLLVIVIGALIGALIYLYNTNETVRNAINSLGQTFMDIGNMIVSALQGVWDYITSMGGLLPEQVSLTGNNIIDSILGVIGFLLTLPLQLGMIFANMIAKTMGFGDNFVQRMFQAAVNSVTKFIGQIRTMASRFANELWGMLNSVKEWAAQLWQRFRQAALDALNAFLGALGIHSPGIMQEKLVWEIQTMGERVPRESKKLLSNIGSLGSDIVDEFGDPKLSMDYSNNRLLSNTGNVNDNNNSGLGGLTINMEIGSVDNEERVNEIVDAIIHRLTFENATAWRTV